MLRFVALVVAIAALATACASGPTTTEPSTPEPAATATPRADSPPTPEPTRAVATQGGEQFAYWRLFVDLADGAYVDGEWRSRFHDDAFRWVETNESAPGYSYRTLDDSNGPGDAACVEYLHDETGFYSRTTNDRDTESFQEAPELEAALGGVPEPPGPASADELWVALGLDPPAAVERGVATKRSELDAAQVDTVRRLFGDPSGSSLTFPAASLTVHQSDTGQITELVLQAERRVEPETVVDDGTTYVVEEAQTLRIEVERRAERPYDRLVTADSTRLEAAGCHPWSRRAIGEWELIIVIEGASQFHLEDSESGSMLVDDQGSITGAVGCRSFVGESGFGFYEQVDLQIRVDPPTCDSMSPTEVAAAEVLEGAANLWANERNKLFAIERDAAGDPTRVAVFAPPD